MRQIPASMRHLLHLATFPAPSPVTPCPLQVPHPERHGSCCPWQRDDEPMRPIFPSILLADSTPSHVTSPTHPFLTEHGSILHRHIRVSFRTSAKNIYPSEGRFDQDSLISSIVPVLSPLDNHLSWCPDIYKWRDLSYNKRIK